LNGVLVDFAGPRICWALTGVALVAGSLLLGNSGHAHDADRWNSLPLYGSIIMAVGGNMTLMASFSVGFLLPPKAMDAAISVFSICFDSSGTLPVLMWLVVQRLDVSVQAVFACYATAAAILNVTILVLWCFVASETAEAQSPKQSSETKCEKSESGEDASKGPEADIDEQPGEARREVTESAGDTSKGPELSVVMALPFEQRSVKHQVLSVEFILAMLFSILNVVKSNVYLGSNKDLLQFYGDTGHGYVFTTVFGISLAVSAPFAPVIAWGLQRWGFVAGYRVVNLLALAWGSLCLVPSLALQPATFFFYSFYRASFYSIQCAWHARKFGPRNVGRLHGMVFAIAACVNMLQQPAVAYAHERLGGDVRPIFVALLVSILPCIALVEACSSKLRVGIGSDVGQPVREEHVSRSSRNSRENPT